MWDGSKVVGGAHPGIIEAAATPTGVAFEVLNGAFAFVSSLPS